MTGGGLNEEYAGRMAFYYATEIDLGDDPRPPRRYPREMDALFNRIAAEVEFLETAFAHGYYGA